MNNRKIYLDVLKFISIFIVFIYHIVMDNYVVHDMVDLSLIFSFINRPNVHLAMLACSLFIMISGTTLCLSQDKKKLSYLDFIKNRFLRILIPFYISYIIYYIIKCINVMHINPFYGQPIPRWRFIFTVLGMDEYVSANGIATYSLGIGEWFLGCIILCYLVFILIYNLNKKYKFQMFIIFTLYYILICMNYDKLPFRIAAHMNFFCQIYNFYMGINLSDTKIIDKYKKILLPLSILIILFIYNYQNVLPIHINICVSLMTLSMFVLFYYLNDYFTNNNMINKFINVFNKYSYEFFLTHHFVIYQINYILNYKRISYLEMFIIFILDIILTCIFAYTVNILSKVSISILKNCNI